ncbi:MAG: hypothetical protein NVSMB44_20910 [Ktedonobacteraceae bacterium]
MTRKDSEKESERPHYYSQFWLDVAAGRRVIGAPKPNEDGELIENEIPEPMPQRRARPLEADMRSENIMHPVAEPVAAPEEFIEPDADTTEVDEDQDVIAYQEAPLEDADIPDMDLGPVDEEEEEFFEEEEEEDEDMNWGRGRKKNKPTRPVKAPPKKPGKREPRRGY